MPPVSMAQSGFSEHERELRSIDQAGEQVTLRQDFHGSVVCRVLVVEAGVSLTGRARAEQVFVRGRVEGAVDASEMTIGAEGEFFGECRLATLKLAGRAAGLIRAAEVIARAGSSLGGELIADVLNAQENVEFGARLALGKGMFENAKILDRARERHERAVEAADAAARAGREAKVAMEERLAPTVPADAGADPLDEALKALETPVVAETAAHPIIVPTPARRLEAPVVRPQPRAVPQVHEPVSARTIPQPTPAPRRVGATPFLIAR